MGPGLILVFPPGDALELIIWLGLIFGKHGNRIVWTNLPQYLRVGLVRILLNGYWASVVRHKVEEITVKQTGKQIASIPCAKCYLSWMLKDEKGLS